MVNKGIATSKIARIWDMGDGFIITDFENHLVTNRKFDYDYDAEEWALNNGYEEIFWEEYEG